LQRQINTIMTELLKIIPRYEFDKLEKQYNSNYYTKYFTGWQQLLVLLFAQAGNKDSLREIETSLKVHHRKWYHIGLKNIKRSTLSDNMNKRPFEIYQGLFYKLLEHCKSVTPKHKFRFKNPLFSIDSTTINLCLNIFPWAKFRKRKGAIKLHYLYDHSGSIPSFMTMTEGKRHDVTVVRESEKLDFSLLPDSIISIDRAYIDYQWLNSLNKRNCYFVTRNKINMKYKVIGQHKEFKHKIIARDDRIQLYDDKYPGDLRLVGIYDEENDVYREFMTNNFKLSAKTIADIYKSRWDIELFFKWIKQNLKIKSFLGTSPNAVLSQVWIAMCYYLLLTYIKYQTKFSHSITELSRMFKEVILERTNLIDILSLNSMTIKRARSPVAQLSLF
jgi:hypothetical protein